MKAARMSPRMLLAGFVPVERTSTRYSKRNMAVPKPDPIPGQMDMNERSLSKCLWHLSPWSRKALSQICQTVDLLVVDGSKWLLVPADERLLHTLSTFECELDDLEYETDDDKHNDAEPDNHAD